MRADDRDEVREAREIEAAWRAGHVIETVEAEQKREITSVVAGLLKIVGGAVLWLLGVGLLVVGAFFLYVFFH